MLARIEDLLKDGCMLYLISEGPSFNIICKILYKKDKEKPSPKPEECPELFDQNVKELLVDHPLVLIRACEGKFICKTYCSLVGFNHPHIGIGDSIIASIVNILEEIKREHIENPWP